MTRIPEDWSVGPWDPDGSGWGAWYRGGDLRAATEIEFGHRLEPDLGMKKMKKRSDG